MALSLSGCKLTSWPGNQTADADLIYKYLLEQPGKPATDRQMVTPAAGYDKRVSPSPRQPSTISPASLSIASALQCLELSGIPAESFQGASPTNYAQRAAEDAEGKPIDSFPRIIVLHETVVSEQEALRIFKTPHQDDSHQSSYHMLIPSDGRRVRVVFDRYRAFGAGDSAFHDYTIHLDRNSPGSINNIALHLSLVTPSDGRGDAKSHSGYTDRQYISAAAQVLRWQASYAIPMPRVTTHQAVDQSNTRTDPRSFDWVKFYAFHARLSKSCGLQAYAASG